MPAPRQGVPFIIFQEPLRKPQPHSPDLYGRKNAAHRPGAIALRGAGPPVGMPNVPPLPQCTPSVANNFLTLFRSNPMTKLTTTTLVTLLAAALFSAYTPPTRAATPDMAAAQQTVDHFAPWISAIILQKTAIANSLFPLRRSSMDEATSAESLAIYARFSKLDDVTLNLIGVHVLGDHIETLLFTAVTDDGPVAFKISTYRVGTETRVGKVQIVDHWSEIDNLSQTVELLPTPVTAPLQSKPR